MTVSTMKRCLIQAEDFDTILNLSLGELVLLIESVLDVISNDTEPFRKLVSL